MPQIYKVSELTRVVKDVVEAEFPFVWVRGQASNVSRPASGHVYFTLRDEEAALGVVWFKNAQRGGISASGERYDPLTGEVLSEPAGAGLVDGAEVLCAGRLTVYPPRGTYQLVAELVQGMGEGRLHLEFEALKRELAGKGYFDEARKMRFPAHPERVAVVTAATGAAVRDFIRVGRERGYGCEVRVYPTLVQGDAAPGMIAAALDRACADGWAEGIALIRGGGSLEDLWAFNTREVADAIFRANIPVMTGVGHEVDTSIADLVSDVRAATPSHAAQMLWPERETLIQRVDDLETAARQAMERLFRAKGAELEGLRRGLSWLSPVQRLSRLRDGFEAAARRLSLAGRIYLRGREDALSMASRRLDASFGLERMERTGRGLDDLQRRLEAALMDLFESRERGLERASIRLGALDPKAPLARGYSLVTALRSGKFLRRESDVVKGDKLDIILYEGRVRAEVTDE